MNDEFQKLVPFRSYMRQEDRVWESERGDEWRNGRGCEGGLSEKSANNEPIACIVDVLYTYCTIAKTFPSYSILLVCWLTSTISKRIVTLLANFAVWQCIWKRFIQNFHYRTRVFFCIISREYYTYTTSMPNLYIYIFKMVVCQPHIRTFAPTHSQSHIIKCGKKMKISIIYGYLS